MLHHLCSVVVKGTSGVFDSSAADPGAARWLSMVTSAIDETVTPLKELIFFFFDRAGDSTSGVKDENGLWIVCQSTGKKHRWTCPRPHSNTVFLFL